MQLLKNKRVKRIQTSSESQKGWSAIRFVLEPARPGGFRRLTLKFCLRQKKTSLCFCTKNGSNVQSK
jgi:hypothetical protein